MMDELIRRYDKYGGGEDELLIIATYVEDQLKEAGAVGGKDYTILDCFKLAMEQIKVNSINKLAESTKEASESLESISSSIYSCNKE